MTKYPLITNYISNTKRWIIDNKVIFFVYFVMSAMIIFVLISGMLTGGEAISSMFWRNPYGHFMDYFASIFVKNDPYATGAIYPPLITLFYFLIGSLMDQHGPFENGEAIRATNIGMMSFLIITILSVLVLYKIVERYKNGNSSEKNIFFLILLFSLPMLYALERGNSIILAFIFLLIYVLEYDSDDKVKRYIAYFCLAISVGIKLYPIIFILLSLKEKRYKESLHFMIITILLFFIPLAVMGADIFTLFDNLFRAGTVKSVTDFHTTDLTNLIVVFKELLNLNLNNIAEISGTIKIILIIITSTFLFINKKFELWKSLLLISATLFLCSSFSVPYNALYFIPAFLVFMNERPSFNTYNMFYAVCFLLLLVPMVNYPIGFLEPFQYGVFVTTLSSFIESTVSLIILIMLMTECFFGIVRETKLNKINTKSDESPKI